MGSSGGGKQTQTSKVELPDWLQPYVKDYLGQASDVFFPSGQQAPSPLPNQQVAPLDILQQQALQALGALGAYAPSVAGAQQVVSDLTGGAGTNLAALYGQQLGGPYPYNNPNLAAQGPNWQSVPTTPLGQPFSRDSQYQTPTIHEQTVTPERVSSERVSSSPVRATPVTIPNIGPGTGRSAGDFSSFTGKAQNPYLDPYYQAAARQLTDTYQNATEPNVLAQGIMSGTLGSTGNVFTDQLAKYQLGENLNNLAANIYEPAYAQERQLQFGAQQQLQQDALQRLALANAQAQAQGQLSLTGQIAGGQQSLDAQIAQGSQNLAAQSTNAANALQAALANQGTGLQAGLANQAANLQAQIASGTLGLQGRQLADAMAVNQGSQMLAALGLQGQLGNQGIQNQLAARGQDIGALGQYGNQVLGALGLVPSQLASSYLPIQQLMAGGSTAQQQAQNVLNAAYQNAYQQAMWPYQQLSMYGQLLGGVIPGAGGTSVQVGKTSAPGKWPF